MTTVAATSAARRTPSTASSSRLQRGASGAAVKELQQLLKALGLYGGAVGGHFGAATEAAVKAFQRSHGLTVDGWAGPKTMAALRKAGAPAPAPTGGTLVLGAKGDAVKELQLRLQAKGFYNGAIGGNFGPGTEAAVKAFQLSVGLTPDGWAGPQTMAKLRGASGPAPATPTAPNAKVQAALDFGVSHVGAPYVGGGSPFRFGTPGNGRVYQMSGQRPYRSPAGVVGFDCSGLVVAMFRKAGVDLAARGIASSATMKSGLPPVGKNELRPGDLLVKGGSHVVIYLGNGKVLEAAGGADSDGDGLGNGSVRVSDAAKFLRDSNYVGRRVEV